MTSSVQRRATIGAAALLAAGLAAFGSAPPARALPAAAPAAAPAGSHQAARFEIDFLQDMVDHHQMAVMMAEMCVDKAIHPDLAGMCQSIIDSQSAEIDLMQTWLQDWYGITHLPDMTGMQSMHRLQELAGADFEIAFLRSMIRHHWGAIREAERCLARAEHPELLTLCESIRAAQLHEIAQMQDWLAEWYGLRAGRPA